MSSIDQVLYVTPTQYKELKDKKTLDFPMTHLRYLLLEDFGFSLHFLRTFGDLVYEYCMERTRTMIVIDHRPRGYTLRRFDQDECPGFIL